MPLGNQRPPAYVQVTDAEGNMLPLREVVRQVVVIGNYRHPNRVELARRLDIARGTLYRKLGALVVRSPK